jgi:hypothetical protein
MAPPSLMDYTAELAIIEKIPKTDQPAVGNHGILGGDCNT